MQTQKEDNSFSFTYSASEQEEIKKIRQKYQPQEESKMDRLRRMDAVVTRRASRYALSVGITGALIMGMGMSLAMTDLGERMGLLGAMGLLTGIIIGVTGIALVCLAYPLYHHVAKKEREKIAPEILKLTEELMK